jgi:hypothetical protein
MPLQDAAGKLLPDASKLLRDDGNVLGFGEAIAEHSQTQPVETTLMGESELEIMSEPDTVAALKRLQGKVEGHLTFFRLRSTDALVSRLLVWPVLAQLSNGTPPEEVIATLRKTDDRRTGGLVQVIPASFICYPLLARSQPLAAVFTTAYGSQVVAVLREGHFVRPIDFTTWPIGKAGIRFGGPGRGVYETDVSAFPDGHAEGLLRLLVRRADAAIHHLTAPERFTHPGGEIDPDGQLLLWSSVLFGMDAVTSMGEEWNRGSAIWTAFRALGILQGIWQGDRAKAPPLSGLLDPNHVQQFAVDRMPKGPERDWASGILQNWDRDLSERFPNSTRDQALRSVAEVRNLVHGVTAGGNRTRRLRVLHQIDEHEPNLQLVNDIAAMWWTSVLMDPRGNANPGHAPWEGAR